MSAIIHEAKIPGAARRPMTFRSCERKAGLDFATVCDQARQFAIKTKN